MRPCVFQKIAISVRDELTISEDLVRQERWKRAVGGTYGD